MSGLTSAATNSRSVAVVLTGLWQVSGKNHTTFNEMIELDIRYLKTVSPWRDVRIMLRTPLVLFAQVAETIVSRKRKGSSASAASPTQDRKSTAHPAGLEGWFGQPPPLYCGPLPGRGLGAAWSNARRPTQQSERGAAILPGPDVASSAVRAPPSSAARRDPRECRVIARS